MSTSVTGSVARVGGGDGDRRGEITFLSGEFGLDVDSGRGEVMDECVYLVGIGALSKEKVRNAIRLEVTRLRKGKEMHRANDQVVLTPPRWALL